MAIPKYYVRPDGLHETIIKINGKRKAFRGKTDREVWEKVKAFDRSQQAQEEAAVVTFDQVADAWWEEIEPTISPTTVKGYDPAMARAVKEFSSRPVASITAQEIDGYIKDFAASHARKTVATQLQVIRQILRRASAKKPQAEPPHAARQRAGAVDQAARQRRPLWAFCSPDLLYRLPARGGSGSARG